MSSDDCTCPRWQPTERDDYECPDDSCDCELHCVRPMTMAEMLSEMRRMADLIDAEECWCTGTAPTLGCPTHWPAPGGAA